MAKFTVRMVLKDGDWEDYENLHEKMEVAGFSRTITGDDGRTYHLPDAEYNYEGNVSRDEVIERAKAAGDYIELEYAVLVTEAVARRWDGLDPV